VECRDDKKGAGATIECVRRSIDIPVRWFIVIPACC
jgi:hypothetical protein